KSVRTLLGSIVSHGRSAFVAGLLLFWAPDIFAATATWTGGGDGVSWTDSLNWSGNVLPNASSDVTIGVLAGNPTIKITSTLSINSLTSSAAISVTAGSRNLAASANINAAFTLTNAALTTTGASVTFVVTGATVLSDSNISAQSNSTISFASATTLTRVNL